MFDALKKLFGGDPPSQRLTDALYPLQAHSEALFERCVRYVHDGSDAQVIQELEQVKSPDLVQLMANPGRLENWWWPSDQARKAWRKLGLKEKQVAQSRNQYYSSAVSPERLIRFGRLLAALAIDVNRTVKDVPVWLTALLNDVVGTFPDRRLDREVVNRRLRDWRADLVVTLLTTDGVPADEAPALAILALCQPGPESYYSSLEPHDLPGMDDLLVAHGRELTPALAARLGADGRTWLMERAAAVPAIGIALAPVVATLCTDTAKGPRTAALNAFEELPAELRAEVVRPVLAKVTAARGSELVNLLGRDAAGAQLLDEAVAAGAKIATLVDQAAQRREAIDVEVTEEPLELPPFEPLPDARAGQAVLEELRAKLKSEISRGENSDQSWARNDAKRASAITEGDLVDFVAIANGEAKKSKLLSKYNMWWLSEAAPSLTLVHLLRLKRVESAYYLVGVIRMRADDTTDLRAIEDAIRRAGVHADQIGAKGISQEEIAKYGAGWASETAWPWFAEHPDVLPRWLRGDAEQVTSALGVLAHFPRIPTELVPLVAQVAMSESRTNRPLAQAALTSHPAALALATQGLADGKGESRAAAANWIAQQGDPAGIAPLRAALKKETRPNARAAMLTALETLGDDISGDLAPKVLLAEATKGLKAKPPTSMAWFDSEHLPVAHWADGSPVDPAILRWWFVLAVKLKDPDGSGLFDRYLSLLDADDAANLGRHALRSWIAQDTRHPDEAESRAHAATAGQQAWQNAQDYLARARSRQTNPEWLQYAEREAARPVEDHVAQAYRYHQGVYLGSAIADKGMLALTSRVPGIELANAVQSYIRNNDGRRSQVEALVYALYANGDPAAIQLLLSISRRFKQASVQAKALELVERLAEARGWSPDELADRTIPAAGFSEDRLLHLSYGPREFLGRVNAKYGIDLTDADGKPLKALPSPRAGDDEEAAAEAKKQLTTSRKELKAVLTLQTSRLYEAMCAQRHWTVADWREFLLAHPLMSQLVTRLIWLEVGADGARAFRPTEDGELIDAADEPIELAEDAQLQLAHRVLLDDAEVEAWRAHLADYEVTPLFDQLTATAPSYPEGATELTDLKGHMTDTFSFRGVATKRGFARGAGEDGGWFSRYTKGFSSVGLTAVLEFTGSILPEENIPCATESLSFERRGRSVRLDEVPPVLVAECYADYAALAALGPFDPEYQKKSGY
ncbi:MAG: DUF4132 domain-containing protein [Propionicimonas sp.]